MELRRLAALLFGEIDYLVSPTAPIPAFAADRPSPGDDPEHPFEHICFTVPWNFTEQPAVSINAAFTKGGLPIGVQIVGRRFDDHGVLKTREGVGNRARPDDQLADAAGRMSLQPKLMSFDVFGTLISVRDSSYGAFERILADANAHGVDVKAFWEHWEHRNIAHYWKPYRSYREICALSLAESFSHFGIAGDSRLIERYFDAFPRFFLYDDVVRTLDTLSRRYRLAVVSNIDDDLLALTPLRREFDLVCTAQRAKGYKPDGTLFRYLIEHAGCHKDEILHSGQSQFTDMVGAKPLGLTVAWINRRGVALDASVPRPDFVFNEVQSLLGLVGA